MTTADLNHWYTLSIEAQMGNIGSEVSRALSAHMAHNEARKESALDRMIDLFSASKSDIRWHHTPALRELCLASEVVCDYFYGDNEYVSNPTNLMKYFDEFARVGRH
jgi:hypothetical protein